MPITSSARSHNEAGLGLVECVHLITSSAERFPLPQRGGLVGGYTQYALQAQPSPARFHKGAVNIEDEHPGMITISAEPFSFP